MQSGERERGEGEIGEGKGGGCWLQKQCIFHHEAVLMDLAVAGSLTTKDSPT